MLIFFLVGLAASVCHQFCIYWQTIASSKSQLVDWLLNLIKRRRTILPLMKFIFCCIKHMKHGRPEAHPSLSHSVLYWGSIYLCRKNDVKCYLIEWKVVLFFLQKKTKQKNYGAKLIFWSFATFFCLTIFWSGAKQRFCFREIY